MSKRPATPQSVFDKVAPFYDILNSVLSFSIDRRWRYRVAHNLQIQPGDKILDMATGTAALAIAMARLSPPKVTITGCDINAHMLQIARDKIRRIRKTPIELIQSSSESLPFPNDHFDIVTIAFAIDDMNREICATQMYRLLKSGGKLALLELSLPEAGPVRTIYELYLLVFPLVARLLKRPGYDHLREEILTYRGAKAIEELLLKTGFVQYQRQPFSGGIVTFHMAYKP